MAQEPFNPLDKVRLAESISRALLERPLEPLDAFLARNPPVRIVGAGVYALYYLGHFSPYEALLGPAEARGPIYVGKAVPPGSRVGGMTSNAAASDALHRRLREHANSIVQAANLDIKDFNCRWLVVDDIFVPLGENRLIDVFSPLWNVRLPGFGNHAPGSGRGNQQRSPWDTVHPGRTWANRLPPYARTEAEIWEVVAKGQSLGEDVG